MEGLLKKGRRGLRQFAPCSGLGRIIYQHLAGKGKALLSPFFARMAASASGPVEAAASIFSFDFLVEAKHLCENCSKDGSEVVLALVLDVEACNKSDTYSKTYGYVCPSLPLVKKRVKGVSVSAG